MAASGHIAEISVRPLGDVRLQNRIRFRALYKKLDVNHRIFPEAKLQGHPSVLSGETGHLASINLSRRQHNS
jgi:hypothetical protein